MSEKQQQASYPLRMPSELREQLEQLAARSKRSLNAEIVARLEESVAGNQQAEQIADLVAQKLKNELARMTEGKLEAKT